MTALSALLAALAVAVLLGRRDEGRLTQALPASPARDRLSGSQVAVGAAPTSLGSNVLRGAAPSVPARVGAGRPAQNGPGARWSGPRAACLLAGVAVVLIAPHPVGMALALVLALAGPGLLGRLEPRERRAEREQLAADLPLLLDLLASCLAGGAAPAAAADAVAAAVPGPAGRRLAAVAAALSVGCPAGEAWSALAGPGSAPWAGKGRGPEKGDGRAEEDPLAPAARALGRAADGGAPVAAAVSRLATEARADARAREEQAARRVGVLAVVPLGLCFLPAFVLLGIVPVVAGLAGPLLASF